jgi:hypothetical protein
MGAPLGMGDDTRVTTTGCGALLVFVSSTVTGDMRCGTTLSALHPLHFGRPAPPMAYTFTDGPADNGMRTVWPGSTVTNVAIEGVFVARSWMVSSDVAASVDVERVVRRR